ncbi:MAG: methyltransferase [Oscillospiraceae bacterium]|jgi:hypothetical protein|nr:methyltransferase [Oscillospiraceae bacterium]
MSIPFDQKEITEAVEAPSFFGTTTKIYKYPVTAKEAYKKLYERKPVWQIMGMSEIQMFSPEVTPDNIARGFVFDGSGHPPATDKQLEPDMFGIEWEFVAQVGGSMVRPGTPFLSDANEWREKLVWPDIEKWDWEKAAKDNAQFLTTDKFVQAWFLTGWFERLISFMDFEAAAYALVDEDQQDAVKELFLALSDLYIKIFDKYLTYFPQIDGFSIHDDWGGQKSCFFSPDTAEEIIVPAMRKVTDYLHSRGIWCDLHSCGQEIKQIPNFIKGGWDSWSGQPMNDTQKEYELYGDDILISVAPDLIDLSISEEEQRAKAREYADKFANPAKPSFFNYAGAANLTPAYSDELYKQSRLNYAK